jgi:hypothetical protein
VSNDLSVELRRQLFKQESEDPFLTLVTLTNPFFTARLVNNSKDISSRGQIYSCLPMKITLPVDDGQTARSFSIDIDNVSLSLITGLRTVVGNIGVTIEMVLASMPDVVQMSFDDLSVSGITYNATKISATIIMDNFLAVAMTSEVYSPSGYPGLF